MIRADDVYVTWSKMVLCPPSSNGRGFFSRKDYDGGGDDVSSGSKRLDLVVAELISKCYVVNPSQRITAANLVTEIEQLVDRKI
mmetsp:Transcript_6893/g.17141  ORF Transcript_6893/g.17141 Transcript_6893/m.17141 type:complete len:84 (-) Transcript_6893:167-418(-)